MGWFIHELENTLKVPKPCLKELLDIGIKECLYDETDTIQDIVNSDGVLFFNSDHMEHMDFLWMPKIQKVLKKYKVSGKVRFCDVEGDNAGTWWSYEFDGNGKVEEKKGKL